MLKKPMHLSSREILALSEGRPVDPDARDHLSGCERCTRQVEEARRTVTSMPYAARSVFQAHPDEDLLLALIHSALSASRGRQVRLHLRQCSRCLARFERLQQSTDVGGGTGDYARQRAMTRARLREMTPRPGVPLGRLVVRWLRDVSVPDFDFIPAEAFGGGGMAHGFMSLQSTNMEECEIRESRPPEPAAPQPTVCLAGPYRLEISAPDSPRRRDLLITIHDRSGEPLAGEPVALEVPGQDRKTRGTDDHGRFRCPLPTHSFRLRIGEHAGDPGWSLEIEVDG